MFENELRRVWLALDRGDGHVDLNDLRTHLRSSNVDDRTIQMWTTGLQRKGITGRVHLEHLGEVTGYNTMSFRMGGPGIQVIPGSANLRGVQVLPSSQSVPRASVTSNGGEELQPLRLREAWYKYDPNLTFKISYLQFVDMLREAIDDSALVFKYNEQVPKDSDGNVALRAFCEIAILDFEEMKRYLMELKYGKQEVVVSRPLRSGGLPAGCEYISGDMDLEMQIKICNLCIDAIRGQPQMKDVPSYIKKQADAMYQLVWSCVIVNGQFWCYYGHQPGYSFVFRYQKYIIIIFKMPAL